MNQEPRFTEVIKSALQSKQQDTDSRTQALLDEEKRIQLNFAKIREILDTIVLPVFRAAYRDLTEAGCYAKVVETYDTSHETRKLTLRVSLDAGPLCSTPPQTYASLSFEGNASTLAFTVRASGATTQLPMTAISDELVTGQTAKFISNSL
jgi:hypothetical protein